MASPCITSDSMVVVYHNCVFIASYVIVYSKRYLTPTIGLWHTCMYVYVGKNIAYREKIAKRNSIWAVTKRLSYTRSTACSGYINLGVSIDFRLAQLSTWYSLLKWLLLHQTMAKRWLTLMVRECLWQFVDGPANYALWLLTVWMGFSRNFKRSIIVYDIVITFEMEIQSMVYTLKFSHTVEDVKL